MGLADIFKCLSPEAQEDAECSVADGYPFLVHPPEEEHLDITQANIAQDWSPIERQRLLDVLRANALLLRDEIGCSNDDLEMPVPFRDGVEVGDLTQKAYNIYYKGQRALSDILDSLKEAGIVEPVPLGQPSPAASPASVPWRQGKPRVVVDLRRINTKTKLDAYPRPRQDDIFCAMGGACVF